MCIFSDLVLCDIDGSLETEFGSILHFIAHATPFKYGPRSTCRKWLHALEQTGRVIGLPALNTEQNSHRK